MEKREEGESKGAFDFLIIIIFFVGAAILLYPSFSNLWNQYRSKLLMTEYEAGVRYLTVDEREEIWKAAQEYNANHTVNVVTDTFSEAEDLLDVEYKNTLDSQGNGIMGSISIPSIGVNLPIYHGTAEKELEKGCGHLKGTSLPVGGVGTHAVIAAHRGLPSARLFTDLDRVKRQDVFYLSIMDKKLAYEVDQIKIVLPEEIDELEIVDGEDYVTLVTCTPYGVNSHRLLVRGHRIEYREAEKKESERKTAERLFYQMRNLILTVFVLVSVIIVVEIGSKPKRRRKRKNRRKKNVK